MVQIKQLTPCTLSLQFHLESPTDTDAFAGDAVVIRGWMATDDPGSQWCLESDGVTEMYPFSFPPEHVATQITQKNGALTPFGFTHSVALNRFHHRTPIRVGVTRHGLVYWLYAIALPTKPLTGILLGGSNSVILGGFADGLVKHFPGLKNLAAGASSSLQNLFELIRHRDLALNADFIVTESNVNDSVAAKWLKNTPDILKNIDWFYHELSHFHVPTYVLLNPLKRDGSAAESPELMHEVNECHRRNARRYGYHLIDLEQRMAGLDHSLMDLMMADPRHPLQIFMYHLAENLARYVIENRQRIAPPDAEGLNALQHSVYLFEEFQDQKEHKANARFDEWVLPLSDKIRIPERYIGKEAVGIATWSDDYSSAILRNRKKRIIKLFTSFSAFNEFCEPFVADAKTTLAPNFKKTESEKSLNTPFCEVKPVADTKLLGMLFREGNATLPPGRNQGEFRMNELIPELHPYIQTIRYYRAKKGWA